jgi:hypothetical protein
VRIEINAVRNPGRAQWSFAGAADPGKSSYLPAGLWPRLNRDDRNFLPLPVLRPERAAITGETGLFIFLENAAKAHGIGHTRAHIRKAVAGGPDTVGVLLQRLVERASPASLADEPRGKPPTLVVSIDQGEEPGSTRVVTSFQIDGSSTDS